MTNFPRCSVVVTYDEDNQQLILQSVAPAKLASAVAGALKMPILLDEFDFRLDDEFVRRFGGGVLNLIALGQPDIKQYMTFTPHPIDRPSGQSLARGWMMPGQNYGCRIFAASQRCFNRRGGGCCGHAAPQQPPRSTSSDHLRPHRGKSPPTYADGPTAGGSPHAADSPGTRRAYLALAGDEPQTRPRRPC